MRGHCSHCGVQIYDPLGRIKLVNTVRLRARLLEFLKFRVLSSQETFFEADTLQKRQQWLSSIFPEALQLSEQDLDRVWIDNAFVGVSAFELSLRGTL